MNGFVGMEKLSLVDFDDKITCTLFTEKCNFRCPFCHNSTLVIGKNKEIPWDEITSFLKSRIGKLDAVCISGGEPTLLPNLKEYLQEIKSYGYLIKLDTNGYNDKLLKELIDEKLIDYVAMDIKNTPKKYQETTGNYFLDIKHIENSIKVLKESGIRYEFRTTLVKEFHQISDIEEMGKWLDQSPILYLQHFMDQGNCIENNLHEISKEETLKYQAVLSKYIKKVELRGY